MRFTSVLIVGGGPSGAACGIRLQQLGVDCLLVDKATFPRQKLCAGLLTVKSRQVLQHLLGEQLWQKLLSECLKSRETTFSVFRGMKCVVASQPSDKIFIVDRPRMDHFLVRHFVELGGKMMEGNGVSSIDFEQKVATLQSGEQVQYRYLVAADGASSRVEHLLARATKDYTPKRPNAMCMEVNVRREDFPEATGVNLHLEFVPDTYAWVFAKGDTVCLGLGQLQGHHFDAKGKMLEFMKLVGVRHAESYPLHGAPIPFRNWHESPVWHGHLLLVGDAAGLIEPVTAEGIFYALQSGIDAADAIAACVQGDPTAAYLQSVRRLHASLRCSEKYQKMIQCWFTRKIFYHLAPRHQAFVGYFYDQRIDRGVILGLRDAIRAHKRLK